MTATNYEQDAERYANARDTAVDLWRRQHPTAYRRMLDGAMDDYHGELDGFPRRMAYLQRCVADAAGFPSLAIWLNAQTPTDQRGKAA